MILSPDKTALLRLSRTSSTRRNRHGHVGAFLSGQIVASPLLSLFIEELSKLYPSVPSPRSIPVN